MYACCQLYIQTSSSSQLTASNANHKTLYSMDCISRMMLVACVFWSVRYETTFLHGLVIRSITAIMNHCGCCYPCVIPGADLVTCLWDVGTGEVLATLDLPDILYSLSFNCTGEKLVSTSKDKLMRVHNARTLEVLQVRATSDCVTAALWYNYSSTPWLKL